MEQKKVKKLTNLAVLPGGNNETLKDRLFKLAERLHEWDLESPCEKLLLLAIFDNDMLVIPSPSLSLEEISAILDMAKFLIWREGVLEILERE